MASGKHLMNREKEVDSNYRKNTVHFHNDLYLLIFATEIIRSEWYNGIT